MDTGVVLSPLCWRVSQIETTYSQKCLTLTPGFVFFSQHLVCFCFPPSISPQAWIVSHSPLLSMKNNDAEHFQYFDHPHYRGTRHFESQHWCFPVEASTPGFVVFSQHLQICSETSCPSSSSLSSPGPACSLVKPLR